MNEFERQNYFIDDEGIGKTDAYRQDMIKKAIQFAKSLMENDDSTRNVTFLCSVKDRGYQWLPADFFNSLWKDGKRSDSGIMYRASSLQTYRGGGYYDIVISMGCVSSALDTLDKFDSVKYVIAVPWAKGMCEQWIERTGATKIE